MAATDDELSNGSMLSHAAAADDQRVLPDRGRGACSADRRWFECSGREHEGVCRGVAANGSGTTGIARLL